MMIYDASKMLALMVLTALEVAIEPYDYNSLLPFLITEKEGFEPSVRGSPVQLISSEPLSTTQPLLQ